jgi:hypothetical protein
MCVDLFDHPQTAVAKELGELDGVHPAPKGLGGNRMPEQMTIHPTGYPRPVGGMAHQR